METDKIIILTVIILVTLYFGIQLRNTNEELEEKENKELIQKYLLTENLSVEVKKTYRPKLWIHTKYDINARKWSSFGSRNTKQLNQPYLHLTIKSIIQHCGNDFHICLIDDDSFAQLLPEWSIKFDTIPEPFVHRAREYGIAMLLYTYGGIVVPNSFICFHNLLPLYKEGIALKIPFVTEKVNHYANIRHNKKRLLFVPDSYIMGCLKNDAIMGEWMEYIKVNNNFHFQSQSEFLGDSSLFFMNKISKGEMLLIDGGFVGVKTTKKQAILLDDLMENNPLDLLPSCYGVYIPADELLSRTKYEWYAVLNTEELLKSKPIITKYLIQALYTDFATDMGSMEESIPMKYVIPSQIGGGGI